MQGAFIADNTTFNKFVVDLDKTEPNNLQAAQPYNTWKKFRKAGSTFIEKRSHRFDTNRS